MRRNAAGWAEASRGVTAERLLTSASALAAVAALVLLHGVVGYEGLAGPRLVATAAAAGFVGALAVRWWARRWRVSFLKSEAPDVWPAALLPVGLLAALVASPRHVPAVVELYLVAVLVAQVVRLYRAAHRSRLTPALLLVISWLAAVAVGTGLLLLPRATADRRGARFSTALFTATSALCVTGLTVEDTGTYWSRGGQAVVLSLVQTGGVGLMTFAAFSALLLRRGLALRERVVLRDVLSEEVASRTGRLVVNILALTLAFEAVGAALLYGMWEPGHLAGPGDRLYFSVFHAVSAFCNAGFALRRNSFVDYADHWQVVAVVCPLVICGGLGFSVLVNIGAVLWGRIGRRLKGGRGFGPRLTLHSGLVLTTTVALLLAGTLLVLVLERRATLAGLAAGPALRRAFFQSVAARTAGFNTVEIARVTLPTACVLMAWMFIGASPVSTGGGIKTSTVAVLMGNLFTAIRGRPRIEVFRRTVSREVVARALAVVTTAALAVGLLVFALTITEGARWRFEDLCFEAVSAFGTVGLSRGITEGLSESGRFVLTAGMLLGRIGPLTVVMAMYRQARPVRYEYPEEPVMVG